MTVYLASDHRGFSLKNDIKQNFPELVDVGPASYQEDDDYVDFGSRAVKSMQLGDRAILMCGSGHGMDITANRFPHIRAILGFNETVVKQGREHEDANVLVLPSDWTDVVQAIQLVKTFMETSFSGAERHLRRLEKLSSL